MPTPDKSKRVNLGRPWLEDGKSAGPLPQLPCNLKKMLTCCGGKGYQVTAKGALAHAELCHCVKDCPACLGRARQLSGNDSKPCLTPAPNSVVSLINSAMIPARYAEAQLSKFSNYSGNAREIIDGLNRWKARFKPVKSSGVIIEGPVGVGKTYLLAALAKEFAERGMSVRFTDFFQLLGVLKAGFSEGKADSAQLMPLINVDVLFIDELGKGRNNEFELTILDQLVSGRYNQSKTIIATTNYRLDLRVGAHEFNIALDQPGGGPSGDFASERFVGLEQRVGPRIFSRLKEMTTFVKLSGDDYRRRDPYAT